MKLNKKNRYADCQHCFKEYVQKKSNQKFCSASCRVGNHNLNKPQARVISRTSQVKVQNAIKKTNSEHMLDLAKSSAPIAIDNLVKSIRGINNSDLNQKLNVIINNQSEIKQKLNQLLKIEAKIDRLLGNTGHSDFVIN